MSNLVVKLAITFVRQLAKPASQTLTNYVLGKPELRRSIVSMARVRLWVSLRRSPVHRESRTKHHSISHRLAQAGTGLFSDGCMSM